MGKRAGCDEELRMGLIERMTMGMMGRVGTYGGLIVEWMFKL